MYGGRVGTCPTCQGDFENATFCPRDGSRLETPTDVGALLGARYRLIRRVGEGAMGVVFEAEHVSIHRRVAVKVLRRNLVTSSAMVERLRREAQVTSGLGHPNIVECLDFGTEDGQVYLVMEWLDGETLEARFERDRADVATVLDIAAQTCAGLAEAHAHGVIHRDLKPANLFLTRDRTGAMRVKILDFGIAKLAAEQTQLTSTGVLVGTPNYMAPEQALGEAIDARVDIYALGIILYELLVGSVPFQGDTPLAVLHQHTAKMPALPSAVAAQRGITAELDTLVMTCLAKAPVDRYQTMQDLGAAIEALRRGESPKPPTRIVPSASVSEPSDVEEELAAMRPRRGRLLLILVAGIAVLAGGVVAAVLFLGRPSDVPQVVTKDAYVFVPSSLVDAEVDASAVDPVIADGGATVDSHTPDVAVPTKSLHAHAAHFAVDVEVSPAEPRHGESVTLSITLDDLDDRAREALAAGRLKARVTIQHFAHHEIVAQDTLEVDAAGHTTFTWTPREGKHHVAIEALADTTSLGRAKFDVHAD